MHSKLVLGASLFSASSFAQISIDGKEANKVASDLVAYAQSLTANSAFETDVVEIASSIPSSVIEAAESDPEGFVESLIEATATPTWYPNIPTGALDSLETLIAKPIKAVDDLGIYIGSVFNEPGFTSVISVLGTAVPSDAQSQIDADPVAFFQSVVTATAPPAYITALPSDIQSDIGSVINKGLSIIGSDFEGSATAASLPTITKKPQSMTTSAGAASATGSSSTNGTSVVAFTGGASSVVVSTGIAGALAVFGGILAFL